MTIKFINNFRAYLDVDIAGDPGAPTNIVLDADYSSELPVVSGANPLVLTLRDPSKAEVVYVTAHSVALGKTNLTVTRKAEVVNGVQTAYAFLAANTVVDATNSAGILGEMLQASDNLSHPSLTPATARTNLGLGTLATQSGTFSGTSSGTNTGDQFTSVSADKLIGRGNGGGAGAAQEITLGTNLSMTGTTLNASGGGDITIGTTGIISGTAGRILFESATNKVSQSTNLFWDNTNTRLGIGTSSPDNALTVIGSGRLSLNLGLGVSPVAGYLAGNTYSLFLNSTDANVSGGVIHKANNVYQAYTYYDNGNYHIQALSSVGFKVTVHDRAVSGPSGWAFRITPSESVLLSSQALATTATDGFTYIPTCAGAPTGVPTTQATGAIVPMVYDTTNDKFYIYRGGWKSVTLA